MSRSPSKSTFLPAFAKASLLGSVMVGLVACAPATGVASPSASPSTISTASASPLPSVSPLTSYDWNIDDELDDALSTVGIVANGMGGDEDLHELFRSTCPAFYEANPVPGYDSPTKDDSAAVVVGRATAQLYMFQNYIADVHVPATRDSDSKSSDFNSVLGILECSAGWEATGWAPSDYISDDPSSPTPAVTAVVNELPTDTVEQSGAYRIAEVTITIDGHEPVTMWRQWRWDSNRNNWMIDGEEASKADLLAARSDA